MDKNEEHLNIEMYEPNSKSSYLISDPEDLAHKTVDDVVKKNKQGRNRCDTLLFKFVRGGNVQMVNRTLDLLKKRKIKRVNDWVLGKHRSSAASTKFTKVIGFLPRVILCLVSYILMVILTPVFYVVHVCCNGIINTYKKRVSDTMDLPLSHAVLSENEHMVMLFTDLGVRLDDVDQYGNNVLHFLFDLSKENYEKAKECFDLILRLFPLNEVKMAILDQDNEQGYTALDILTLTGSLKLLKTVTEIDGILRRTVILVDEDDIHICADEMLYSDVVNISPQQESDHMEQTIEDASFSVQRYDVTQYEQGDIFHRQSKLLELLTERNYISSDESELEALSLTKWISKWSHMKVRSTRSVYIFDRILTLIIGSMFLYIMFVVRGGYSPYPLAWHFMQYFAETMMGRVQENIANYTERDVRDFAYQFLNALMGKDFDFWSAEEEVEILDVLCGQNYTLLPSWGPINSCASEALLKLKNDCKGLDEAVILEDAGLTKDKSPTGLSFFMIFCLVYHTVSLVFDLLFRTAFFLRNYPIWSHSILQGPSTFFSTKIPGSYIEKQMAILSSSFFVMTYIIVLYLFSSRDLGNFYYRNTILIYSLATGLTIIMFQLIYILRLFPVIGLFIRTTVYLTKNLLEFLVVYLVFGLGFAVIFYFALVDEKCPAKHMEGYGSILNTFYGGYLGMLGQGDLPVEYNTLMKIVYGVYSLLSAVMLLNLIIAIMSTTADRVMVPPWRDVLYHMDVLSVALYNEALLQTFFYPFRKWLMKRLMRSKELVEYKVGNMNKLYIEIETL